MSHTPRKEIKALTVCVVGLGYVGLPLAEAFAQNLRVIGYRWLHMVSEELIPTNHILAKTSQK